MKKILLAFAFLLVTSATFGQALDFLDQCSESTTFYSIEEALKDPQNVRKLDLSMQKLKVVPSEIVKFTNLECLDLSFNHISDMPAELAQLKNLKVIYLTGTRFMAKCPENLKLYPALVYLDIRDHQEWPAVRYQEAITMLPKVKVITK